MSRAVKRLHVVDDAEPAKLLKLNVIERLNEATRRQLPSKLSPSALNVVQTVLPKISADVDFTPVKDPPGLGANADGTSPLLLSPFTGKEARKSNELSRLLNDLDGSSILDSRTRGNAGLQTPKKSKSKVKSPRRSQTQSPVKTRSIICDTDTVCKKPHCIICEAFDGEFMRCQVCEIRFHAQCIGIDTAPKYPKCFWRCFDCLNCAECLGYIYDAANVQCDGCGQAYHGKCQPNGSVSFYPFDSWHCITCLEEMNQQKELAHFRRKLDTAKTHHDENIAGPTTPKVFVVKKGERAMSRKLLWETLQYDNAKLGLEVNPLLAVVSTKADYMFRRNEKLRKENLHLFNLKLEELMADEMSKSNEVCDFDDSREFTKSVRVQFNIDKVLAYQQFWPSASKSLVRVKPSPSVVKNKRYSYLHRSLRASPNKATALRKTPSFNSSLSSKKTTKRVVKQKNVEQGSISPEMEQFLQQFSVREHYDKFAGAVKSSKSSSDFSNTFLSRCVSKFCFDESTKQYLHFGPFNIIPAKKSILDLEANTDVTPMVYVCNRCFILETNSVKFRLHLNMCEYSCPPGTEIYRETVKEASGHEKTISFFEVIGEDDVDYCRRLCTVAGALLPAKSVDREADMFKFYILTEFSESEGFVPVGFFSKENKPSKNNNLSCIVILNHCRALGYGKLLVDLSYELSRRERKFGSAERPLSNDGLRLYRSYWQAAIFSYLRKLRAEKAKKLSFEEISRGTQILIDDVVTTLISLNMLKQIGDKFYVDCSRAWFSNIKLLRRRTVDAERLVWEPVFDPNVEHCEYYVCTSDEED